MRPDPQGAGEVVATRLESTAFTPVANVWRRMIRPWNQPARGTKRHAPEREVDTLFRYGKVLLRSDNGAFWYTRRL